MKKQRIEFGYVIREAGNVIDEDIIMVDINEKELKEAADEVIRHHGGHMLTLDTEFFEKIADKVVEHIFCSAAIDRISEDADMDEVTVELTSPIPSALMDAVDSFIPEREVHLDYAVALPEGSERHSICTWVGKDTFANMVSTVPEDHNGMKSFEVLRKISPEAYDEVHDIAMKHAASLGYLKEGAEIQLGDFPYEVFDYV